MDERQSQFTAYQKSCEQVEHILQHWDLARGLLLVPVPDALLPPHDGATKRQVEILRHHDHLEKIEVHPFRRLCLLSVDRADPRLQERCKKPR